jgi:hypothetical protein
MRNAERRIQALSVTPKPRYMRAFAPNRAKCASSNRPGSGFQHRLAGRLCTEWSRKRAKRSPPEARI